MGQALQVKSFSYNLNNRNKRSRESKLLGIGVSKHIAVTVKQHVAFSEEKLDTLS